MYLYLLVLDVSVYCQCSGDLRGNCMLMRFNQPPTEVFGNVLSWIYYPTLYILYILNILSCTVSRYLVICRHLCWPFLSVGTWQWWIWWSARQLCHISRPLPSDHIWSYSIKLQIFLITPCPSIQMALCSTICCQIVLLWALTVAFWIMVIDWLSGWGGIYWRTLENLSLKGSQTPDRKPW